MMRRDQSTTQQLHSQDTQLRSINPGNNLTSSGINSPYHSNSNRAQRSATDEEVRVVFLGASKVGKTALIQRFLHNRFDSKYVATVEDLHSKKYIVRDQLVRLVLVDTAGSFDFPAMFRLYISKASAFVIVFANDNAESLRQAETILNQIKCQRQSQSNSTAIDENDDVEKELESMKNLLPPITVVCNKSDLAPVDSQLNEDVIMEWLLANQLKPSQFVYASAKTNEAILEIFKSLWAQNEVSRAIVFDYWDPQRRISLLTNAPRTPPPSSPSMGTTDFSALSNPVINWREPSTEVCLSRTTSITISNTHKPRSSLIRSSLRLSRRSSSKSTKPRADVVRLECVLS